MEIMSESDSDRLSVNRFFSFPSLVFLNPMKFFSNRMKIPSNPSQFSQLLKKPSESSWAPTMPLQQIRRSSRNIHKYREMNIRKYWDIRKYRNMRKYWDIRKKRNTRKNRDLQHGYDLRAEEMQVYLRYWIGLMVNICKFSESHFLINLFKNNTVLVIASYFLLKETQSRFTKWLQGFVWIKIMLFTNIMSGWWWCQ